MLYLCTSHPGGSARTVVSPRAVEASEGGVQGRARRGAPDLLARLRRFGNGVRDLDLSAFPLVPGDEWDIYPLEKRLPARLRSRAY